MSQDDNQSQPHFPSVPTPIKSRSWDSLDVTTKGMFVPTEHRGKLVDKLDYSFFEAESSKILHPITYNGELFLFNPETNLYQPGDTYIRGWVHGQLSDAVTHGLIPGTVPLRGMVDELVGRITRYNCIPGDNPFDIYPGIPLNNCVLVFDKGGVVRAECYKTEMKFTRKLPVNYNPEAQTENVEKILKGWLGEDYHYLIQIPAQALYQSLPQSNNIKTSYILVGEANAGKSAYLDLLERLFGWSNISHLPLQELGKRFSTFSLVGKYLNTGDDLADVELSASNSLKLLTGSKIHLVEPKHKTPYNVAISAVHIYAANKPPKLPEALDCDNAWWDRWVLLKFQNLFEKVSGWKEENFTQENLEGFLLLVLMELREIIMRGGSLSFVQLPEDVRESWKHTANPLTEFLEEETERGRGFSLPKEELFAALDKWAEDVAESGAELDRIRRRLPKTKTALSNSLIQEGIDTGEVRVGKQKIKSYMGIRWKQESKYRPRITANGHL